MTLAHHPTGHTFEAFGRYYRAAPMQSCWQRRSPIGPDSGSMLLFGSIHGPWGLPDAVWELNGHFCQSSANDGLVPQAITGDFSVTCFMCCRLAAVGAKCTSYGMWNSVYVSFRHYAEPGVRHALLQTLVDLGPTPVASSSKPETIASCSRAAWPKSRNQEPIRGVRCQHLRQAVRVNGNHFQHAPALGN